MPNNYKCDNHTTLDLVCRSCIKSWIARHDALLEFTKKVARLHIDRLETLSARSAKHDINLARALLIELGKDK
jgi:hypothetical protein